MSMVRFQQSRELPVSMVLAVSARTWDDILYRDELLGLEAAISDFHVIFVLTRDSPRRPTDYGRRMDSMIVTDSLRRLPEPPMRVYICGSNPFVNTAADSVIRSGLSPQIIRTERYGG
jgi:ferredoxin-NADP reductase